MDRNQGNQGGRTAQSTDTGNQGGSSRGLGNMDQDDRQRGSRKGGEVSSREQGRDGQGQFTGKTGDKGTDSIRGGLSGTQGGTDQGMHGNTSQGGSRSGGQGGSSQGGSSKR